MLLNNTSDFKETSFTCKQTEGTSSSTSCIFKNAIVFKGDVYIISESSNIVLPNVMCSVADTDLAIMMCKFKITTKKEMLKILLLDLTKVYGIITESALYFGPLSGNNLYHLLFEEMIPLYEILKFDPLLSKWLDKNNSNTIKLLLSESFHGNAVGKSFYERFFPHIDYTFRMRNSNNDNTRVYLVNYLVAAGEFRDFIFSKVGINNDYRKTYHIKTHANKSLILIPNRQHGLNNNHHKELSPRIVIIQRSTTRIICNMNEIISTIQNITNITPLLIDYAEMTYDNQMQSTFETDILIMVHGGGLGNVLYLPPFATLIEIYPYTYTHQIFSLMNWVRYALRDIPIAHAPFDIIDPNAMIYSPNNFSLPLCLHNPINSKKSASILFWNVKYIKIDINRFHKLFRKELRKWHSRTNYVPPMTREVYRQYNASNIEP
eukprot:gene13856-29487_t